MKEHQDERRKRGFGRWFGTAGDQKPIGGGGDGDHDTGDTEKPFIPDKVYQMQSDWYSAVLQKYGLPLDSRHLYTKSDWEFFAAAVTGKKTRMEMLEAISLWVNETVTGMLCRHPLPGFSSLPSPFLILFCHHRQWQIRLTVAMQ